MKKPIQIINRTSGLIEEEQVWGGQALHFLYGKSLLSRTVGTVIRLIASQPICTRLWGYFHDRSSTRKSIPSFCKKYAIDINEFEKPISAYTSFNDFFVRSLKPSVRPTAATPHSAILPADARYHFFKDISKSDFLIKGQLFNLTSFFESQKLAQRYHEGTAVLARLCPTDCHRFVFPVSGIASESKRISGSYLSVSPIATHTLPSIFWTNVREVTFIQSDDFGIVAMVEIGATNCASIVQTYTPGRIEKGQEKGYFRLGGSAIMLVFEKGKINLSTDLKELAKSGLEVHALYGQELGTTT